ncbi:MAG: 4Fe-4S binding protein [Lachnospiraceae bacterium]|nr:4Fe-4S binding protein [Lachnospiraceae bacterium]
MKRYASVNPNQCVACGECAYVCPRKAVSIQKGCYAKVDDTLCVGCGLCERCCPAGCITLIDRDGCSTKGGQDTGRGHSSELCQKGIG